MKTRNACIFALLAVTAVLLFILDMAVGSVNLAPREVWDALFWGKGESITIKIVRNIRLLKALAAILTGAALCVSGQQMQTLFRNPLAGPYVLGITSGASLGVAVVVLGAPWMGLQLLSSLGLAGAAWVGAAAVLLLMAALSARVKDIMVILIIGMMLSSGIGAIVQIMQYTSHEEALKLFVVWTMGSLGDVTVSQLWIMTVGVMVGLALGIAAVKPLNMLTLGEQYAVTMGLNPRRSRLIVFGSTTLLAGTVTAFCGPIGFIGMAIPHVARALMLSADHRILLPANVLMGIVVMLICDIISKQLALPINSVTALLGIPVVVWVVWRSRIPLST